jgi:hypothetical protein
MSIFKVPSTPKELQQFLEETLKELRAKSGSEINDLHIDLATGLLDEVKSLTALTPQIMGLLNVLLVGDASAAKVAVSELTSEPKKKRRMGFNTGDE